MYEIKGYIIIHVSSVSSSIILYTCTCTYIYMYVNYYQLKCVLSGDISVYNINYTCIQIVCVIRYTFFYHPNPLSNQLGFFYSLHVEVHVHVAIKYSRPSLALYPKIKLILKIDYQEKCVGTAFNQISTVAVITYLNIFSTTLFKHFFLKHFPLHYPFV